MPNFKFLMLNNIINRLGIWILAFGILIVLLAACGRLPPEKFWSGDGEDSTSIKSLIVYYDTSAEWKNFLSRMDFAQDIDTIKYSVGRVFPNSEVASLEFRIKQAYGPARLRIALTEKKTDTNIVFVYDTTATVELITKFKGVARVDCEQARRYLKDTVVAVTEVPIFQDDMTNFPLGWTTGGTGGPWTKIEDSTRSKSKPYSVKCTPYANYEDNQNNWMARSVDLANYEFPKVTFSVWRNLRTGDSIYFEFYDTIWNVGWVASGIDTTFKAVTVSIPKTATTIRFRFYSDVSETTEGVYLDDISLTAANVTDTLMLFGDWAKKEFLHDSVIRGETVLVYDSVAPGKDSIVMVKEFEGRVWRSLHFEPEVKSSSPRIWRLIRVSGGASTRIPDNEDDAPYNYRTIVKEKNKVKADTILNRPDTIHYGIHRLYKFPDSIYSYGASQDSLEISQIYPILNPQDTALYFAYCDKFYSLVSFGSGARLKLTQGIYPSGINFLSFIICPRQSLIYKKSPFKLRVWQIPIKLQ
uniref:Uncharacterized protein n=1 Tax=candidate division WOR-3 bacterium TaxID=2052148 RepID=A0A7C6A998_UNCW3